MTCFKDQEKMKAVTFSFDDGIVQDYRMIELLNKYGLKATFNLSSGLLGHPDVLFLKGQRLCHYKVPADKVKATYEGHEVAAHGCTHPRLEHLEKYEIIQQVDGDRQRLEELVGCPVVGMAYPYGSYDDRVVDVLRRHTGIQYARTTKYTDSFDRQEDLLRFKSNAHILSFDRLMEMGKQFIELQPDKQQIFYVWGHTYEMDYDSENWSRVEEFFKLISGHEDIFYGTNAQVLL